MQPHLLSNILINNLSLKIVCVCERESVSALCKTIIISRSEVFSLYHEKNAYFKRIVEIIFLMEHCIHWYCISDFNEILKRMLQNFNKVRDRRHYYVCSTEKTFSNNYEVNASELPENLEGTCPRHWLIDEDDIYISRRSAL